MGCVSFPRRVVQRVCAMALLLAAAPAGAEPVVYTLQATLTFEPDIMNPLDAYDLDGATLVIVATGDTAAAPAFTSGASAFYDASSITASFSNRPNGAPNVMFGYGGQLGTSNNSPPSSSGDQVVVPLPPDFQGAPIQPGVSLVVDFPQDFFAGTGVAPLPAFEAASVVGVSATPSTFLLNGVPQAASYSLGSISVTAAPEQACGDGIVGGTETCDDGNSVSLDGCSAECAIEHGYTCPIAGSACISQCGDGLLAVPFETCDDGNTTYLDGCSGTCQLETGWQCPVEGAPCSTVCGDGITAGSEQCDDANGIDTDACLNNCKIAQCGDGVTWAGVEQCDDGNLIETDACLNDCSLAVCGDGFIRAGVEQCDDGNTVSGDGCSSTCRNEAVGVPALGPRGLVVLAFLLGSTSLAVLRGIQRSRAKVRSASPR